MNEQKILNTFDRVLAELDRYSKVFRSGGQLERAVAEVDGDIAWFDDIRNGLEDTIHAIEEAHMSAGIAMRGDFEESTQLGESVQLNEGGLLDSTDEDGFMTRSQLYFMARDAIQLHGLIGDRDEVEPWIQKKVARAAEDVESIRQHVEYSKMAKPAPAMPDQASGEEEQEFHQELDTLVHDTFGKRPEEMTEGTESSDGTVKTVTTDYDNESTSFDVYHNGKKVGDGWFDLLSGEMNFNGEWYSLDGYKTTAEKLAAILNGANESVLESDERPYVCVHAKKGKTSVTASTSYEAAQKAAAKWGLKSTSGISAYLADVKHVATEAKKMKGEDPCWDGYEMVGMKKKGKKEVPNCVPKNESLEEGADLDDGSKALNPQTIAKNMMKAAKAQAAKKVKK